MTMLVATHNPLVASRCDRIARLQDGRIVDVLSVLPELEPEEVLERITRLEASS
jgi:putative ABC transport system ATP-binding protein